MTEPEQPAPEQKPQTPTEESAAEKAEPPAKRRRWPWVVAALVLLFVAGGGAGIYFLPDIKERLPFVANWLPEADKANAELTALGARLDRLESQLSTVRSDVARHDGTLSRLDAEDARLATGIARVEALAQTLQTAPPPPPVSPQIAERQPEKAPAAQPAPGSTPVETPAENGALAARLDMLMLRMGQIESAFVPLSEKVSRQEGAGAERATITAHTQALDARVDALSDRLGRLEQAASADAKQALLVLTYASLRRAAEAGRPILAETRALAELADGEARAALQPALDGLQPLATTLTPSRFDLKERLPMTVRAILDAARLPENASWWQKVWAKLTGLVTLRRTGEVAGNDVTAIVARAEARIDGGDLEGAVDALGALSGPAARTASNWLNDARRRLALDAALDDVERALSTMTIQNPAPGQNPAANANTGA